VQTWSPGAEAIYGYCASDIIGRHFSTFYPVEDVSSGKCERELRDAALYGRFEDEGWRVRKDGARYWANAVISAMRGDDGELLGFAKVTRDLTERLHAETERAARLAAEQASRAKDEFLAMLSHELRNPLAPIVTALHLLKLRGDNRTSREQQIIERQVNHMMHLVDDMLDISRITRGKVTLKKGPVDIRDVVARAIEVASPLLEQRKLHFDVDVPSHPIIVDGDDARLTQIFANLLVNAAKYTETGGHVWLNVRADGSEVLVQVRDDGLGIPADLLPKIFDLFVQGTQGAERSSVGLGIGLALVKSLLAMHGGTIQAHSAGPGAGSTFVVRLPLVRVSADETRASPVTASRTATPRRVLVVDDNQDAIVLLDELLSAVGHDVRTAYDAAEALAVVRDFVPDVAVLDIGLPVMDGYALATALREQLGTATPRMIALTGYGQQHDQERSRQAGFALHLVKPIEAQRLLDAIVAVG
jgi:PAS domain S-box-containing protein